MKRFPVIRGFGAGSLLILAALAGQVHADSLIDRLKTGGHILMIRHALAPGTGDPADFQIDDCRTQRNLSARGRTQARAIGEYLRGQGIARARIYSSQWCRCLETARLVDLGPVTPLPALNSFFERPEERERRLADLGEFIARLPRDGDPVIMVTHFVTIGGFTGEGVSSGEGVVLALRDDRDHRVVGRLGFGAE